MTQDSGSVSAAAPAATSASTAAGSKRRSMARRNRLSRALFVAPSVVVLLAVILWPFIQGVIMSMSKMQLLRWVSFVGFDNYVATFTSQAFWASLSRSGIYVAGSVIVTLALALPLALVLSKPMPLLGLLRTLIIVPWVISQVAAAMLWLWIVDPRFGILNWFFKIVGLGPRALLADQTSAMATVIVANVWGLVPLAFILLLAAVQTVNPELVDAAHIDGAGPWQVFRYVTVPHIAPAAAVTTIMLSMESFNGMALVYTMTGGGPAGATNLLAVETYRQGFLYFDFPVAATMAIIMAVINLFVAYYFTRSFRDR